MSIVDDLRLAQAGYERAGPSGWKGAQQMEDAANLIEALEAELAAQSWQPIETSPKDGTLVDLWCASNSAREIRETDCRWLEMTGWVDSFGDAVEDYEWRATHWMPLPEPPA